MEISDTKGNSVHTKDLPVTNGMLLNVRDELKSDIRGLEYKMESRFAKMESDMHQMKILMEQQFHQNKFVMDHLTSLFERQDRVEKKLDDCLELKGRS